MKHIRTTIAALRARCPFAKIDQRGMFDTIPELLDVDEAVKAYQRPADFFTSEWYLRQMTRADYQGAPMDLRLFVWKFLRALRARGLPFYVHTCYRSPEEQLRLKKEGRSQTSFGAHQRSCAVDIVSSIDHWEIPSELWYYVGTLGEQIISGSTFNLDWGGRWNFYDPAHWELTDWRDRLVTPPGDPLHIHPYSDRMRFG